MNSGPADRQDRQQTRSKEVSVTDDHLSTTTTIPAPADAVFAVLADPTEHAAIDGTGWVRQALDTQPVTAVGQVFRMAMYHPNRADGNYQVANRVQVFDRPKAIAWEPGQDADDGWLTFGGWVWRYDLVPAGPSKTEVTLSYDWSVVPDTVRQHIGFPPFPADHLGNSLAHLAELVRRRPT